MAVIFVSLFVLITPFLFEQTIPMALYGLLIFFLLLSALVINNTNTTTISSVFVYRFTGTIILLAIPLMVISFVLFPRMIGPLWAMPKDSSNAVSGIADTINPGLISNLALSKKIAFRARFQDKTPAQKNLYWRGPVFWNTDGRQWKLSPSKTIKDIASDMPVDSIYNYSIIMEPHQQFWLYGLDSPISAPKGIRLTEDHQLINKVKLTRSRVFEFTSSTTPIATAISDADKSRALTLPNNTDNKIYKLAETWRGKTNNDIDVINTGLQYFNQQDFYYTLTPPTLGNDPVADFLFKTKRGFCGHYATSYAVVLRAAGIPARLVAGYQGGVYNELGDFWEVRQADAHVWVEAWVETLGWLRVDPTAAIAPNRIEHSINLNNQTAGDEIQFFIEPPEGFAKWGQQLNSIIQTVDYYWEAGVLAYGPEVQNEFLSNVGIDGWEDMVMWLAILGGLFILLLATYMYHQTPQKVDPVQKAYLTLCKKLAKKAGARKCHETSSDYFQRAINYHPRIKKELLTVKNLYLNARYGKGITSRFIESLKQLKL
jgi:transglutaminase-like putative cysteine protease